MGWLSLWVRICRRLRRRRWLWRNRRLLHERLWRWRRRRIRQRLSGPHRRYGMFENDLITYVQDVSGHGCGFGDGNGFGHGDGNMSDCVSLGHNDGDGFGDGYEISSGLASGAGLGNGLGSGAPYWRAGGPFLDR